MDWWIQVIVLGSIIPTIASFITTSKLKEIAKNIVDKKTSEEEISTLIIKSIRILTEDILAIFESLRTGKVDESLLSAEKKTERIAEELEDFLIRITTRK